MWGIIISYKAHNKEEDTKSQRRLQKRVGIVRIINIKRWHWTVNQKMEVEVAAVIACICTHTHKLNRINDSKRSYLGE